MNGLTHTCLYDLVKIDYILLYLGFFKVYLLSIFNILFGYYHLHSCRKSIES